MSRSVAGKVRSRRCEQPVCAARGGFVMVRRRQREGPCGARPRRSELARSNPILIGRRTKKPAPCSFSENKKSLISAARKPAGHPFACHPRLCCDPLDGAAPVEAGSGTHPTSNKPSSDMAAGAVDGCAASTDRRNRNCHSTPCDFPVDLLRISPTALARQSSGSTIPFNPRAFRQSE